MFLNVLTGILTFSGETTDPWIYDLLVNIILFCIVNDNKIPPTAFSACVHFLHCLPVKVVVMFNSFPTDVPVVRHSKHTSYQTLVITNIIREY